MQQQQALGAARHWHWRITLIAAPGALLLHELAHVVALEFGRAIGSFAVDAVAKLPIFQPDAWAG